MYLRKMTGEYYTIHELIKIMEKARGENERTQNLGRVEGPFERDVELSTSQLYHNNKKGEN